jgi:hypothetical protein
MVSPFKNLKRLKYHSTLIYSDSVLICVFKIKINGTEFSRDKEGNAKGHKLKYVERESHEVRIRIHILKFGPIINFQNS